MTKPYPGQRKQIAALEAAIKVLKDWRRRHYSSGEAAYNAGVRGLTFADDGHKHYTAYTEHIQQLEDLIEILQATPATKEQLELFQKEK